MNQFYFMGETNNFESRYYNKHEEYMLQIYHWNDTFQTFETILSYETQSLMEVTSLRH